MKIWIIDEEWTDYDYEFEMIPQLLEDVEIKVSTYDYWEDLETYGKEADAVLAQVYAHIPKEAINKLENCKVISTYGGGYDRIDINACKEKGIRVTNIQNYCSEDLGDYTLAAMFHFNKRLSYYSGRVLEDVKSGKWGANAFEQRLPRLANQTLFIIGLGAIGKVIAKKALEIGMTVIAYDEFVSAEEIEKHGVKPVQWEEGFRQADYVSVNLKGVDANADKIGAKEFDMMKESAVIINTARGKIIDEEALIEAVKAKKIRGAFLDVIKNEPPTGDEEIFNVENIFVTPHVSYISIESMLALKKFAIENMVAVLEGRTPRDPVV